MLYGYAGTILRIDLNNRTFRREPLSEIMAQNFVGGRGFVAKILYDEMPPKTDPDAVGAAMARAGSHGS